MARAASRLPDWIFGAPGKRRALNALFLGGKPRWTRRELARAIHQHEKARVDLYLRPLVQAGVVRRVGDAYTVQDEHPLVAPLRSLLIALNSLPDDELRK